MPYNRPGPGVYVTNGATAINHGQPTTVANFVGVAVKQKARGFDQPLSNQAVIDPGEQFFLITKGVVQVSNAGLTAAVKGDEVFIAAGALAASGTVKFGRIVEVAGERGTPLNKVRIDLDAKDSF